MATELKTLLSEIVDLIVDPVFVVDEDGQIMFVSSACERTLGYTSEELIGTCIMDLVHPDDRERTRAEAASVMRSGSHINFTNRYVGKDGRVVHFRWSARWSTEHKVRIGVARDVTSLNRAEVLQRAQYRISEAAHAAEALEPLCREIHLVIGDLLPAPEFCVGLYDDATAELHYPYCVVVEGRSVPTQPPAPCVDALLLAMQAPRDVEPSDSVATEPVKATEPNWLGVPLRSGEQSIGALAASSGVQSMRYTEDDRQLLQFIATQLVTAIERQRAEARLRHMAHYDSLTELPNRALFNDRVDMALRRAGRDKECVGLLFLDLNEFKNVNDRYGHGVGDRLLRAVSRRLVERLRDSDTVARMGGDEFTVLLTNVNGPESVHKVSNQVCSALSEPFELDGYTLSVSASIGRAVYPDDGDNQEALIAKADAEMYRQKRSPNA